MSAIVRAAAVLLDASYQTDDTTKADVWRVVAVEARQEYDRLREQRDEAAEELETLKALVEGEPWAGAVMRRERDNLSRELDRVKKEKDKIYEELERLHRLAPVGS